MKTLISFLYALFAVLIALAVYVAGTSYDGLVEDDYYRKATGYLSAKENDEERGLTIRVPGALATGRSRFLAEIGTAGGPLQGAQVLLRAMRISGPGQDRAFPLLEEQTGVYGAEIDLPAPGTWMFLISLKGDGIASERRWTVTAWERETAPGTGHDIHAGPVTGAAGRQPVVLDVVPKPVTAMRELAFTVKLPGYDGPGVPFIDLRMPGMRMPPNRVTLSREPDGTYRGKGVIVRCGSGKRTWTATVTIPGSDKAVFIFDVVH